MGDKKKEWIGLMAGFAGIMLGCYVLTLFNRYVIMTLPLVVRVVAMLVTYWICVVTPAILILWLKDGFTEHGFSRDRVFAQIMIGLALGAVMSVVLTLIPHLLGFGAYVDNGRRYKYLWQFIVEFAYFIFAVAAVEEICFRGFIYTRIKRISKGNDYAAIIVSSLLFGLFHIFSGNILQLVLTTLIGALFCLFRLKIKHCTTLSLIICHGIYDAMISVWASTLLRL